MADSEKPPDSPTSFSEFNIRRTPVKTRDTFFGKIRTFSTITVFEWVYLALSVVGLTTCMGITIQRMLSDKDSSSSDFTFAVLLLVTIVFCYSYVVHAIFTERADELMVFVISNAIVLIYCIVNYVTQTCNTLKLVRLIVVSVVSPILLAMGLYQSYKYCSSNNLIFNTVGGITSLQKACKLFYFCSSLLKFDLQLQLSMLVLVMGDSGTAMDSTQIILLSIGILITLIFITIGFFAMRKESKVLMIIFYTLGLFEPGYIIYKFYVTAKYEAGANSATFESTYACGFCALIVWITLMAATAYFLRNFFGKGLKEKMFGDKTASVDTLPTNEVTEAGSPE